ASMGAYPLAKFKTLPSRNLIFTTIVAALMFAPEVTQIPRYIVVDSLGLIDTYWALFLPQIASAYALFLMKQFIEQVPDEVLESARIDGAGEWTIFWRMIMPLARTALGPSTDPVAGTGLPAPASRARRRAGAALRLHHRRAGDSGADPAAVRPRPADRRSRDGGRRAQGSESGLHRRGR